ncbi:MAG: SUMF1/EgtB/PvdO family nonheme iron enzyme [Anaerolineae bacterium]|nr:SUMF1/EgtB/PvdO family nonheme iron enzyme [Anaerolineae bacterium]RIK15232.1 MAG: hypothetical protein DCC51_14920 [Anaerolineae bacterium]
MSQPDTTQLRQFILDHFNLDELKTLCVDLAVVYDDLGGEGRAGKARELVLFMERDSRLIDLRAVLAQQRGRAYQTRFGDDAVQSVVTSTPPPRRGRGRFERNPRQVFVSHATADAVFAHRLADDLRRAGFSIWIAPDSIPSGQWVSAINRGLAESGVMLLVLTPAAMESPWVEMETNVAIELERAGAMRFIPVCLVKDRYDPVWHAYQWMMFDGSYEAGLDALLRRLEGAPATPTVSPASPPRERYVKEERNVSSTPDRRIHEKTDIKLIRIPAGPFLYGSSDADEMAYDDEKPQRTIDLPEFWIGRAPVTNAQYKRFLDANPNHPVPNIPDKWARPYNWDQKRRVYPAGKADHPVVLVSWDDAKAFCDWAGLALPTEEQWEKAARGTDGRIWPWGSEPPTAEHCNFNGNVGSTTPVGAYSPKGDSPYGCVDMAGNVWEWMESWYIEGVSRALRGGSWFYGGRNTRAAYRGGGNPRSGLSDVGFRVVEHLSDPGF